MPPRRAAGRARVPRLGAAKRRGSVVEAGDAVDELEEQNVDQENPPSFWISFKLWLLSHQKKYSAIAYGIFLCIFTLVVLKSQGTGDSSYILTQNIRSQVEGGYDSTNYMVFPVTGKQNFGINDVGNLDDVWEWLQGQFSQIFFQETWYNNDPFKGTDAHRLFNYNYRLIGRVALRQVRVKKNSCKVPQAMQVLVTACYAEYSTDKLIEDSETYGPADAPFKWQSQEELKTRAYYGFYNSYGGGGYRVLLPNEAEAAISAIAQLHKNRWLDEGSRALFVNANMYVPALNVIALVTYVIEFPAAGGTVINNQISIVRLSQIFVDSETIQDIQLEAFMLFGVFIYLCIELKLIREHGLSGYKAANPWLILDWANFALFVVAYLSRFRALTIANALKQAEGFPPSDNVYISYDDPAFYIMLWKNIFAFNCIITWVKMLKHLGHIPVMTHIIKVMAHCLPGVLNFLFVFIFIFVGSSMAHLLAYGDTSYRFKDLTMSLYSMYRSLFGDFDFMEMFLGNRIIGPAFFIIWTLVGLVVLFNIYEATKEPGDAPDLMDMLQENLMKPMQQNFQALMRKLRGDEEVQPVDEGQDIPSLNAEAGDAIANTGGSAVSSGAPGDAKRRALEASAAAGSDSIRQPASLQLPGQIDAFGVDALSNSSRRPQGYAGLNEQLLTQLTYQIADSDKKLDEIGRRFTGVGGSLQLLSREVSVMSKKLEQLLQQ